MTVNAVRLNHAVLYAAWGDYADAAPVERLDLAGDVRRWGGVRTAGELVPLGAEDAR